METDFLPQTRKEPCQFKSYYVVWKLHKHSNQKHSQIKGLNRTMQYGNYFFSASSFEDSSMFKSYYVVWKHTSGWKFRYAVRMFKSYYVVWKQISERKFYRFLDTFKSYYVVWKPYENISMCLFFESLNRTMQYGNRYRVYSFFPASRV